MHGNFLCRRSITATCTATFLVKCRLTGFLAANFWASASISGNTDVPDNQKTSCLIRWRLGLSEFDYEVRYVKGKKNQVADAISRLKTNGHSAHPVYEEVPCLLLQQDEEFDLYNDLPDISLEDRKFDVVYTMDEGLTPITMEEIILEQSKDAFCCLNLT